MAFTYVTLQIGSGYRLATGAVASSSLRVTPLVEMTNGPTIIDSPVTVLLDASGVAKRTIAATTDPSTTPVGAAYRIEILVGSRVIHTLHAQVPHNAGPIVDLTELIPVEGTPELPAPIVSTSGIFTINGEAANPGGNVVISASDVGAQPADAALTRLTAAPVTLTAVSGVITPNAAAGSVFRHTAAANVTLADPTGGVDGELLEVQVFASGADRVLSVAGATVAIPAGAWWWGHLSYNAGRDEWLVDDSGRSGPSAGSGSGSGSASYTPVTLTAVGGVITPNAALGYGPYRYSATANVTLASPAGGVDGQPIEVQVTASGGDRVLSLAGSLGTVAIAAGATWWGHFSYNAVRDEWLIDDSGGGSSSGGGEVTVADATTAAKGVARILGGTADAPTVPWAAVTGAPAAAEPGEPAYVRGVNMAGGEFAASNTTLPGTYGTDYAYDSPAAMTAIGGRGHKLVRLPFRWERIQPTRGAALNATELTRLQGVVSSIAAAGMRAVLDVHNYARYIVSGGAELVLGTDLPASDLVDLWTRLSTAFKGNAGIYAYGLMNEPHDLAAVGGTFSGTVRYAFASGTGGWVGEGSTTLSNVSAALRATISLGTGSVNMRLNDAAVVAGGATPTGNVVRVKATPVALPAGTWTCKVQWQNTAFAYQEPVQVTMTRVDTGATVTSLTVGQPVYVTATFAGIASPPNAFAIEVDGTGASAGTVTVDFDDFSQGTTTGAKTGAQVWEDASQQCVTAIRGNADTTLILVSGYGFSGAQVWPTNHALPWITGGGNIAYEAHYYFDGNNSGVYASSYATENTAAVSAGYASLSARATTELGRFTDWLTAHNVKGFIGEIGWPNTVTPTSWNTVGDACYALLDSKKVDATYWSAGARWGTTYILSAYTGTAQDVVKTQASVIEAHPTAGAVDSSTLQSQIDGLDTRVDALESVGGPRSAPLHRGPAYMVLGADTTTELATAKANGATHGLVEIFWDRVQSSAGGAVDASGVLTNIANVLAAGLKPCLRVSLQYPPAFVLSGVPAFKQQSGATWTASQASGENIRDWVWSATGRGYVKDLLGKLFTQLDWSKIERVQVGGLRAGELSFPQTDGTVWWGFSTPAQSGTDLAPRMSVCPVPGVTPSTGTTWVTNDYAFVGWYLQSLTNWMVWLIEQHRNWFNGPIYVMHPGAGLREIAQTPTGSQALNYRANVAAGLDWAQQIGSYPDSGVHPYTTWIDSAHFGGQYYNRATAEGDAAPWLHLLRVARDAGRAGHIWGENTGGQTNTDLDRVFQTGAIAHGYQGVAWLSADSLADGTSDTYANFTARISGAA